jgi:DNA-binding response OmpR family regulator
MPAFTLATVGYRPEHAPYDGPLRGKTVLIVEDEPLIALDLHGTLRAVGAHLIAATSNAEALALIRRNEIAAGVVDVALADQDCLAVCQALIRRSVPFLFYTGHHDAPVLKAWPGAPVLLKPARADEIVARIVKLTR